jgi:hypothetical protein
MKQPGRTSSNERRSIAEEGAVVVEVAAEVESPTWSRSEQSKREKAGRDNVVG